MAIYLRRPRLAPPPGHSVSGFAQNLAMWFPLSEGGGTDVHDHRGLNPGTIHGTPVWRSSPVGPALTLDGSTNWIEVPANPSFNGLFATGVSGIFSIAAWVYFHSASEAYSLLYGEEESGVFNTVFLIKSDGTVALYYTSGAIDPVAGVTLTTDKWHHLCWTNGFDGGTCLYVDGIQVLKANNYGSPTAGSSAYRARIGGGSVFGSGRYMNGAIAGFGKWLRQLSPAEVANLCYDPSSLYESYNHAVVSTSGGGGGGSNLLLFNPGMTGGFDAGCSDMTGGFNG
jgi:hypothetical protein